MIFLSINYVLDCDVTVISGDVYKNGNDARFKVANVLQLPSEEKYADNQWIGNGGSGQFILNLGCSDDSYSAVDLINVWEHNWSTKRFKVYLR